MDIDYVYCDHFTLTVLATTLPIWMAFISFVCVFAVDRTSSNMLNTIGAESGHPCLAPYFHGKAFSFSPLSIIFSAGLS